MDGPKKGKKSGEQHMNLQVMGKRVLLYTLAMNTTHQCFFCSHLKKLLVTSQENWIQISWI